MQKFETMMKSFDDENLNESSPEVLNQLSGYPSSSSSRNSQRSTGQHSLSTEVTKKISKSNTTPQKDVENLDKHLEKVKVHEHKIDIGDEKSDLLGYEVLSGKLTVGSKSKASSLQKSSTESASSAADARLTSKALTWSSHVLKLEDVVAVSYSAGLRQFTVHAYPIRKKSVFSHFTHPQRTQKDFHFLASSSEEAILWVSGFADQHCFINLLPHPMASKKQASDVTGYESLFDLPYIKRRSPPKILVILNPRSGHGRSSKVFHDVVEPIFKLAGFTMEVVKTTSAGHAKTIASTVDFYTCPDGIVCVGGDGIVNEVLNGLLSRDNQKEGISIPIGIIPAGSDNSLVWTILGVRDPVSAALSIVRGGLTATDVFSVEWIQSGLVHFGTTVSYYGFLSDVLELSEKYQKRFGPLRYFVAGFLRFLCLPKYSFDLEYLPASKEVSNSKNIESEESKRTDMSDLYADIINRSRGQTMPRASSLSSIDAVMSPTKMSGADMDASSGTLASTEQSDYIRGLDPKSKSLSAGKSNAISEPEEVLHPQPQLSSNPNRPRSRSKTRTEKVYAGLTVITDTRSSWSTFHDKEDISSTVSDPGPIWDPEPKWETEPQWAPENPIELPGRPTDLELGTAKVLPSLDQKWVVRKGHYLAILVCNHSCKTVQSLSSQVVAPKAEYDDNMLDLLLIGGTGRMRLVKFIMMLQFGKHLSLPYVEYVKVKCVKLRRGAGTHNGCGIDGELLRVKGQVQCSLFPHQCRLIGRPATDRL